MERSKIIDHLQDLQNKVDGMGFKGQNEYDLQLREEIADWLLSQIATSETNKKQENETVVKVNRECELCCGVVDKYDKFTEEEHCENCGWS